jgi:hypothetical protein
MITKNNWLTTNLEKRIIDPQINFEVTFDPYPFKTMSFNSAVDITAKEIANNYTNLHLALSGGYDSEFILRAFHKLNINITPIIVCFGTEIENSYAEKACQELGIEPIKISLTNDQYITCYKNNIVNKFNSPGYNAVQTLYAAEYAMNNHCTLITGNHLIGDGRELISNEKFVSSNEWDFYTGCLYKDLIHIDFYLYSIEISYSMLPSIDKNGISWQKYKEELYNLEYREKIRAVYPREIIDQIKETNIARLKRLTGSTGQVWSREEFERILSNV